MFIRLYFAIGRKRKRQRNRQTNSQGVGSLFYFVKRLKLFLQTQLATHEEYILYLPQS